MEKVKHRSGCPHADMPYICMGCNGSLTGVEPEVLCIIVNKWFEFNDTWHEFYKANLNTAGTLIELEGGTQYLIGHMNEIGGVCDDCCEIKNDTIIKRYMVVWSPE